MEQIVNQLKKAHHVLLASHENPDGDAVGSLIAMGLALEARGKRVTLHNISPIPAVYSFLPAVERIVQRLAENALFDTAVILDCGDLSRIGSTEAIVARTAAIINMDHHETNSDFGTLRWVDIEACATAEIVYRLIRRMNIAITREMATAIYTGILTDTGSFRFSNTNRAAFAICEEMVGFGVEPSKVAQHVFGAYSLGRIKLLNLALDSIEISNNGQLSFMTLTQKMLKETGTRLEDADGMINYARRIRDVKVAALIHEMNGSARIFPNYGRYHVSLRSDGDVNVAEIAACFGGGGHSNAAGFSLEASLPEIKAKIISLTEKMTQG
jgi:phosphoesterase RecJ-like protein